MCLIKRDMLILRHKKGEMVSILQVLCKYKIVQKNLFKWTELNSVRFYIIRKISTERGVRTYSWTPKGVK